ncbi:MAG TPA: DEAD/DEAH box helicase [Oligoflexus sp.]|uniref:DEAD/DEAH box helicase n=1 Tax=Oligoflexus sp. TaxID=1971216 RepID=UPI002D2D587E|nr:DEAD/DEAH box helicase [Oligoflexus sp.]HYX39944.1 DEAD/DEAH box helicase [Oligoflexus sp.]
MIPRPYQIQAVDAVTEALKTYRKVGAVLPTGSGKSLVEAMVIDRIVDGLTFNQCVVVTCHLTDVIDQLHLSYSEHGRYGKQAMRFTARNKPKMGTKVVFATIQSMTSSGARKYWTENPMRKIVKAVVIDEAHQFGTDSYETLTEDLFPKALYIGFSATPYRKNQYSFSQFETVAYAISSKELITQGFLVPPKLFQLCMEHMEPAERFAGVIKIWQEKEMSRGFVSVVYLRSKQEAQEMRLVAEEAKIRVAYVSGDDSEQYCRQLFEDCRQGKIEMLVNCRKLETGIDIPNIGAIFMPWGTSSVVTYLQRIGRGLRLYRGKTECNVYVFGSSPSIESGKWTRIQREALDARNPLDSVAKLECDLADLIEDGAPSDRIHWTQEAIKACHLMLDGQMPNVAQMIAEKKFPEKYHKSIASLAPLIHQAAASNPDAAQTAASEAQIAILSHKHKFKGNGLNLTSGEAEAIISAFKKYFSRGEYILQHGPFAGKHIADTTNMYRRHMTRQGPNWAVYQKWVRAGQPKGEK